MALGSAGIWPGAGRHLRSRTPHCPCRRSSSPARDGCLTGTGQDRIRWPTQLAGRIVYLAGAVASNDFPPTDQMREVYDRLHERVEGRAAEFAEIVGSGLTGVNSTLDAEGMPGIVRVEGKEPGSR